MLVSSVGAGCVLRVSHKSRQSKKINKWTMLTKSLSEMVKAWMISYWHNVSTLLTYLAIRPPGELNWGGKWIGCRRLSSMDNAGQGLPLLCLVLRPVGCPWKCHMEGIHQPRSWANMKLDLACNVAVCLLWYHSTANNLIYPPRRFSSFPSRGSCGAHMSPFFCFPSTRWSSACLQLDLSFPSGWARASVLKGLIVFGEISGI